MENQKLWENYQQHIINEGLAAARQAKLKMVFNIIDRALILETAKREQIERFIDALNTDKFKKLDGEPYSGSTKSDIKKFLRQFYKFLRGNNEFYPPEISWLKTRIPKDQKPEQKQVIELKDVTKLAQAFERYEYKIITLLLFDSGFRISEMLSVKKKDLSWEVYDDESNKCFWLACNVSKTYLRNVPVPLFTPDLKAFMESSYIRAKNDNDLLFSFNYEAYLKQLKKHSKAVLGVRLSCHSLRHSSATYYAKKLNGNVPMLAQRYGWSYSAPELQTYVRSSGAYNKEGAKLIFKNELLKLQEDNEKLHQELDAIKAAVKRLLKKEIENKK